MGERLSQYVSGYNDKPMNLLFEGFIQDVIGRLPPDKLRTMEQMLCFHG